jgi:hypothetical protein
MKMFRLEDFTWKYRPNRYLDPYKKKEIFNFIIETKQKNDSIGSYKLSQIIFKKYRAYIPPTTIRRWLHHGFNDSLLHILNRRPCDRQIIPTTLGLLFSDASYTIRGNTFTLTLGTAYYCFAKSFASIYSEYGYTNIYPHFNRPTKSILWIACAFLDKSWSKILQTSPNSLRSNDEVRRFLSNAIDGDGTIALYSRRREPTFYIKLYTSELEKATIYSRLFRKLGYHPRRQTRTYINVEKRLGDSIIKPKLPNHSIVLHHKSETFDFLRNTTFIHPVKELKRQVALLIYSNKYNSREAETIWNYIRKIDKIINLCSKLRAIYLLREKTKYDELKELTIKLREECSQTIKKLFKLQATVTEFLSRVP